MDEELRLGKYAVQLERGRGCNHGEAQVCSHDAEGNPEGQPHRTEHHAFLQ